MPAKPLTPEQAEDAERLKARFKEWQHRQRERGTPVAQDQAAERLGFGQSALSQYLNARIPLNVEALAKFARLLECSPRDISPALARKVAELSGDLAREEPAHGEDAARPKAIRPAPSPVVLEHAIPLRPNAMVPIVGTTQGGPPERAWCELGFPVGYGDQYVEVATRDANAYGLRVVGDSMAPRIMEGEWIVVEPNTEPQPGDEVVVKTVDGEVMVKVLTARHTDRVVLSSVNEAFKRITKPLNELQFMHYVGPRLPARAVKTRDQVEETYIGPDRRGHSQAVCVERRKSKEPRKTATVAAASADNHRRNGAS